MIPLGVVRVVTLVLGGVLPAFASFKALEQDDAAAQQSLLAYWVVFALLTAAELPADAALSWLPLYSESKLALLLWLLTPRFAGAVLLYRGLLRGWLRRHQPAIERTLQHVHLPHGLWALAVLLRGMFGVMFTLARAAWLLAPPAAAQAPPPPQTQPAVCGSALCSTAAAAEQEASRPCSGRPAPPLDTAQVTLLSAGLEESCAMLLRTALATQAGNQLLASLQSQAAVLTPNQQSLLVGQRKRHSRRRTIATATTVRAAAAAATTESRLIEGPPESSGGRPREGPPESSGGRPRDASVYSNPAAVGQPDSH